MMILRKFLCFIGWHKHIVYNTKNDYEWKCSYDYWFCNRCKHSGVEINYWF